MKVFIALLALLGAVAASGAPQPRARVLRTSAGRVTSVAWSLDGQRIAAGTDVGLMHVWPAGGGGEPRVFRGDGSIQAVAWNREGTQLRSMDGDDQVRLWDLDTASVQRTFPAPGIRGAWSANAGRLASTYGGTYVWVWNDLARKRPVLLSHPLRAGGLAWHPHGEILATGTLQEPVPARHGGVIHLWDAASGARLQSLQVLSGAPSSLAWSRDGKYLAAAADAIVHVVAPATGEHVATLRGHTGDVSTLAWRPDGRYLATGAADGSVRVWGTKEWVTAETFRLGPEPPLAAAWSPDGRWLATATGSEVRIRRAPENEL